MIPCQRALFDLPREIAYLNCAYMSPILKRAATVGAEAIARKCRPWTITAADFFTDSERVSFHWPLPAYLALLPAAAMLLASWPPALQRATWATAGVGLVVALALLLGISSNSLREFGVGSKHYPRNFAGWEPLAAAVREELAAMPPGTRLLVEDFKVGA